MILTAIRNNITGLYLPYDKLVETASEYSIPIADVFVGDVLSETVTISESISVSDTINNNKSEVMDKINSSITSFLTKIKSTESKINKYK